MTKLYRYLLFLILILFTTGQEYFNSHGSYKFHYDTGMTHQSFREESRDIYGRVRGRYGFVDPNNVLYITEYEADFNGFRSSTRKLFLMNGWSSYLGVIPKKIK